MVPTQKRLPFFFDPLWIGDIRRCYSYFEIVGGGNERLPK